MPTVKSQKRVDLINQIQEAVLNHHYFKEGISRSGENEAKIQRTVFSELEHNSLPEILMNCLNKSENQAKSIIEDSFIYESKTSTTLNSFNFFAVNHRPDAVLSVDDIRIGFEIKTGDNGNAIRSGIGQSLLYAFQYDFVLYFFVDLTPGRDIKNSISGKKENELIEDLWDNYNTSFSVV